MRKKVRQQPEDNRISYIKKPMAVNSYMCLSQASIGVLLFIIGLAIGIRTQGNIPLGGAAVCFSSLLFSVVGIRYGIVSFREKDKNYILAKIGTYINGVLAIIWLVMILIGFGGIAG